MSRFAKALLIGLVLSRAAPATADLVCRPTELGTFSCPGPVPQPMPRPRLGKTVQGLDRVRAGADARPVPDFIPARRTLGLGGMVIDDAAGASYCRADALGNLHCR